MFSATPSRSHTPCVRRENGSDENGLVEHAKLSIVSLYYLREKIVSSAIKARKYIYMYIRGTKGRGLTTVGGDAVRFHL